VRLGVLGGTFDPVHLGHLLLAERARDELALDRVLLVPAGDPWRKGDRPITPASHRLAMLRLAIAGTAEYEISTLEIERPGPSYTADTLEALSQQRPGEELVLILGEDALADLPNWHRPELIVQRATLAVARRPGCGEADVEALERQLPGIAGRIRWLAMKAIEVSASDVRERVRSGRSVRSLVPAAVESYIREHGLYAGD
jgi:nicotinate-nucleotide adenylyltransferase